MTQTGFCNPSRLMNGCVSKWGTLFIPFLDGFSREGMESATSFHRVEVAGAETSAPFVSGLVEAQDAPQDPSLTGAGSNGNATVLCLTWAI